MQTRAALAFLLLSSCAAAPAKPASPALASCSLKDETACVAYGATVNGVPPRPSAQLMVGLADRSAEMPSTEAIDYWRRILEIHDPETAESEVVNRRVAAAYAGMALVTVDDVPQDGSYEDAFEKGHAAVEEVRALASYAVKWGDPENQLDGTVALARAFVAQAENLRAVELPAELTVTGRAALSKKRDEIVSGMLEQVSQLADGIRQHCRRHQLQAATCSASEFELEP